jgi:hypothetical protein
VRIGAVICTYRHRFGAFGASGAHVIYGPFGNLSPGDPAPLIWETSMPTTASYEAFNEGREERRHHPLPAGSSYKLIEAYLSWGERLDALATVENYLISETPIPPDLELQGWMGFEWNTELRKLPGSLARDIGWRILPAVKAIGDGTQTSRRCQDIVQSADREAEHLVTFIAKMQPAISKSTVGTSAALDRIIAARWLINATRAWMEDAFWAAGVPQSTYRQA